MRNWRPKFALAFKIWGGGVDLHGMEILCLGYALHWR